MTYYIHKAVRPKGVYDPVHVLDYEPGAGRVGSYSSIQEAQFAADLMHLASREYYVICDETGAEQRYGGYPKGIDAETMRQVVSGIEKARDAVDMLQRNWPEDWASKGED